MESWDEDRFYFQKSQKATQLKGCSINYQMHSIRTVIPLDKHTKLLSKQSKTFRIDMISRFYLYGFVYARESDIYNHLSSNTGAP